MSLELQGLGVSRGIAIGRARLLFRDQPTVTEYLIPKSLVEAEVARLVQAIERARQQLHSVKKQIPANAPTDVSAFIDTHMLMLSDSTLSKIPMEMIRLRRCNAEWALKLQRDALVVVFDEMDDAFAVASKSAP